MRDNVVDALAMPEVCSDTDAGWLWYCDEHDSHGNADSMEEAQAVADAHSEFLLDLDAEDADGPCEPVVFVRERSVGG